MNDGMKRNVMLVTIDSLRFDFCKPLTDLFSGSQSLLPKSNLSNFQYAFATGPGTTPSFPAMLTGTLPLSYDGLGPLSTSRPRISRNLSEVGFTTGGFQCNPFLSNHFNYDDGFDVFDDFQNPLMGIATKVFPRGIEINNPKIQSIDNILNITKIIKKSYQLVRGKPRPYVSADVITDSTIDFLRETDSPFFCWAHYMDVHHPCYPPEEYQRRYSVDHITQSKVSEMYSELLTDPSSLSELEIQELMSLYRSSIDYVVDQIESMLEELVEQNKYRDTLIIITSDHGELFGDHGQYGKPERMYDELLRVPLYVANGPDYLGSATEDLVSLLDIPPLIHDALGVKIPEMYSGCIPGKDPSRDYVMSEHEVEGDVIVGARSREWLYEGDEINNEHRLFHLQNNEFEQVDHNHPDGALIRNAVLKRLAELDVSANYLQGDMEANVEDRLEDLGYL